MKKLLFAYFIILSQSLALAAQSDQLQQADRLFAGRDNIESLRQAASVIERLAAGDRGGYEAMWRLAKYRYYLGDRETDEAKRKKLLQAGIDAGKRAVALDPARPEGHFWLAANFGGYAEMRGALESLGLVKSIRKEFEAALKIDPSYENGAAQLALGQIDLSLPRLLGGNDGRGIRMLESGLKVGATNAELKIALAEAYGKNGRADEARKLLESVLAERDPLRSAMEQEGLRSKARRLLDRVK